MTTATRPSRRRRGGPSEASGGSLPIRTRALTKRYGARIAVDSLDLEVRAGEIFGLLGQNGAGKTTTILMLLGLTEPSGGSSRVVGLDPTRHPLEVKRRVGYLPDSVGFYGNMTGRENLRYTARLNGLHGADAEAHIEAVLAQVGLTDRADGRTETYSRGMLQRLGIADALIKEPDVLILDEPTASIDPIGVIEILELLRRLVRERGMTVLLSSHLLDQVQHVCDRVGIFAHGRLIGIGTVAELSEMVGFSTSNIEIFIDEPEDRSEAIATAIKAVSGVVDAVLTTPSIQDTTSAVAAAREADRLADQELTERALFGRGLSGGLLRATVGEARARERVRAKQLVGDPGATGERVDRTWMVTIDAGREVPAMIGSIVAALSAFRVFRIGRHEPRLEEIYRTAVAGMSRGFAVDETIEEASA